MLTAFYCRCPADTIRNILLTNSMSLFNILVLLYPDFLSGLTCTVAAMRSNKTTNKCVSGSLWQSSNPLIFFVRYQLSIIKLSITATLFSVCSPVSSKRFLYQYILGNSLAIEHANDAVAVPGIMFTVRNHYYGGTLLVEIG